MQPLARSSRRQVYSPRSTIGGRGRRSTIAGIPEYRAELPGSGGRYRPTTHHPPPTTRHLRSWHERPNVEILPPGPWHLDVLDALTAEVGVAGRLTTDAHPAALAIEHQARAVLRGQRSSRVISGLILASGGPIPWPEPRGWPAPAGRLGPARLLTHSLAACSNPSPRNQPMRILAIQHSAHACHQGAGWGRHGHAHHP